MPKYDVAVIGASLGGLATAALLACKKKKTIVIEQGSSLSDALGVVEKSGFSFYAGPSLSYGFERNGAIHEFSARLGISQQITVPSPCYQVALPDRRITVFADRDSTLAELRREFPREINALYNLYRDLDKLRAQTAKSKISAYFARSRSAAGYLGKYGFSRELMTFFDVQSFAFFRKMVGKLSLSSFMMLCDTPPRRVRGGFRKFGDQVYGVFLQHGGEVRYNEPSPELVLRGNRVIGIKTTQGVVEADTIILNALPHQRGIMLFIGLREDVIPVGMSQDVYLLQDYSSPQDASVLSLNGNDDDAATPKRMRSLNVLFQLLPNRAKDEQMLVDKLSRLIPFLKDYIVFAEEFRPQAGYTVLPAGMHIQALRIGGDLHILNQTSYYNAFVLQNLPEAPLQVLSVVQRLADKLC